MENPGLDSAEMNDTTMPDSTMMDPNIDDLFGEEADDLTADALGVPLPSAPLSPALPLRIAEMQNRGYCT